MDNELIKSGGCIEPPKQRRKFKFPILLVKAGVITFLIWLIIYIWTR